MANLNWDTGGLAEAESLSCGGKRTLHVGDGHLGYVAELSAAMTVEDALRDFMADYDAGDEAGEVRVDWLLFEDGENTDGGRRWFGVNYA